MRLVILALVLATMMSAQTVGSAILNFYEDDYCKMMSADGLKPTVIFKAERMEKIAEFLSDYTADDEDAKRTAKRYCSGSDDPELWAVMDVVESECQTNAISHKGAQGRLQVMPSWKTKPGFEFYRGRNSHLDDDKNFQAAKKILQDNLDSYKNNKWLAVERYCGVGPDARAYVTKIKRLYSVLKAQTKHCKS